MFQIAVCDDEPLILRQLCQTIASLISQHTADFSVLDFAGGDELMKACRKTTPDLIFLDIDMPHTNGMEIAQTLRKPHAQTEIIFVTNRDELVYESLRYAPFRFIRKSRFDGEIEEALTGVFEKLKEKKKTIVFQTDEGRKTEIINNIMYAEVYGHKLVVHLSDETKYEANGNLKQIEQTLLPLHFIRIHKSYLVSCRYIDFVQTKAVRLDNGEMLPLSRGKGEEVKLELLRYFAEKEAENVL